VTVFVVVVVVKQYFMLRTSKL